MKGEVVSGIMIALLLVGMLALVFYIQPAWGSGTIYIRADGSIDPPSAWIRRDGNLYTFTRYIRDSIVVQRDNIVVDGAGYTLQGLGYSESKGIYLSGIINVTIRNMIISTFYYGVYLSGSSGNSVFGNHITENNYYGIWLSGSSSNSVSGNNITANNYYGILLDGSSNYNTISGNNITAHSSRYSNGVLLWGGPSNNTLSGNNIADNYFGIELAGSSNNIIYHNNFINNRRQARVDYRLNIWDNSYPSGGNYWSNYNGTDLHIGPSQDQPGNDGIGDTPYIIYGNNRDKYPFMNISGPFPPKRTYTLDADFDEGTLVGVEHETVHDQLQLSKNVTTLPFIWVPNSNEGTVSKIDTATGKELGRYQTNPSDGNNPSRTTVDLFGNCWVGCRQAGTVVKIGLYEAGQWVDRNRDGICQTSNDTNNDGNIEGAEILPWGQDECVLFEVVLIPGHEGTFAPGNYTGPYDTDFWGVAPRGLAIDSDNNLWAGTWSTSKYYYVNGTTGQITRTIDVSPWDHHAYGAVIDKYGVLWSSGLGYKHILRLDPSTAPPNITKIDMSHIVYGLGLDYVGHLFVSGWADRQLSRINITTGTIDWTYYKPETYCARGVAVTSDNNVWVANSAFDTVTRYDNDGNLLTTIPVGSTPTGVAVDAAGKVWVVDWGDENVSRIDPATNTIDLSKRIIGGYHYGYSDMTGIISRTITTIYTWSVVFDSSVENTSWGTISWNSNEPEGTSIKVKVRSSNDNIHWTTWETAENGVPLRSTPNGRYLRIQTTFQIVTGSVSPILYDLTVAAGAHTRDVAVTNVIPSKTVVGQGYSLNINVTVANQGDCAETFYVMVYANTTSIGSQYISLTSGNSTTNTFTSNTTGFAKGNYTISAYAWPVLGETDTADNNLTDGTILITIPGDMNGDRKVDLVDVYAVGRAFGSVYNSTDGWYWHTPRKSCCRHNPNCDINWDGKIDLKDYFTTCKNYGKAW